MIRFKFGQPEIALRSMEIYACAVLEATLLPPPAPYPRWREEMDKLAHIAHVGYVGVVREDPDFVPYFRAVTPEGALGRLPLGSRPTKRRQDGGVETPRAILWIFALTQIRRSAARMASSGEAFLQRLEEPGGRELLQDMRDQWPFFGTHLKSMS